MHLWPAISVHYMLHLQVHKIGSSEVTRVDRKYEQLNLCNWSPSLVNIYSNSEPHIYTLRYSVN